MAYRVTDALVREIIDAPVDLRLTPFIAIANSLVTKNLATTITDTDLLREIERWLTAHFISVRYPTASSESAGGVSISYVVPRTGLGLDGTPYGQQVKMLDYTGLLTAIGQRRAYVSAVATEYEE